MTLNSSSPWKFMVEMGHRVIVENVMLRAFMLRTGVASGLFDDFVCQM